MQFSFRSQTSFEEARTGLSSNLGKHNGFRRGPDKSRDAARSYARHGAVCLGESKSMKPNISPYFLYFYTNFSLIMWCCFTSKFLPFYCSLFLLLSVTLLITIELSAYNFMPTNASKEKLKHGKRVAKETKALKSLWKAFAWRIHLSLFRIPFYSLCLLEIKATRSNVE